MIRHLDLAWILQRAQRLYRVSDHDAIIDGLLKKAAGSGGAAPQCPDLAFSGITPTDSLLSIGRTGLRAGIGLGRAAGPNSSYIWFSRGRPFYCDGTLTLVIPAVRLITSYGGKDAAGLAGQSNVMKVPHEQAAQGIPLSEFAIVVAVARGFVVPVYKPASWVGPAGAEIQRLTSVRG